MNSPAPHYQFQIRDFNIAKEEEDISYYAGYVGEAIVIKFNKLVSGPLFIACQLDLNL